MNPLKRNNPSVRATNHENRIQALERRLAEEFPQWGGAKMDAITVETAGSTIFGWSGGPDCTDPSDQFCLNEIVSYDDYLLLPQGWNGVFKVYMSAVVTSGNANFGNYRTVVDGGDQDQHGKSFIDYITYVIDATGTVVDSSTQVAFRMHGEEPPPTGTMLSQRLWWTHKVHPGNYNLPGDQRWALQPYFSLEETLAGPADIEGLTFAVELSQIDKQLPSFGA